MEISSVVLAQGSEPVLVVVGETNLADDAKLLLTVRSGSRAVLEARIGVSGQGFRFEQAAKGSFAPGEYPVEVVFLLDGQTRAVQEAQGFAPRLLSASSRLTILASATSAGPSPDFLRLFEEVNQGPRDPARIAELDALAVRLGEERWISGERAALAELRRALDVARRPEFDRESFDRHVLEAFHLAGLGAD